MPTMESTAFTFENSVRHRKCVSNRKMFARDPLRSARRPESRRAGRPETTSNPPPPKKKNTNTHIIMSPSSSLNYCPYNFWVERILAAGTSRLTSQHFDRSTSTAVWAFLENWPCILMISAAVSARSFTEDSFPPDPARRGGGGGGGGGEGNGARMGRDGGGVWSVGSPDEGWSGGEETHPRRRRTRRTRPAARACRPRSGSRRRPGPASCDRRGLRDEAGAADDDDDDA